MAYFIITLLIGSTLVDELVILSLLLRVVETTGSSLSVATLLFAQLIPAVVFAPLAGNCVDRYGSRIVLICASFVQFPLLMLFSTAHSTGEIYSYSALLSAVFAFTGPAIFSLIPVVAARTSLTLERTNSVLEITRGIGSVLGPSVGGLLIGTLSTASAIQIAACWSLIMLFAILLASFAPRPSTPDHTGKMAARESAGFKAIATNRRLMAILLTFGAVVFSTSLSDVVFVFFTLLDLNGGPLLVGCLMSAWSLGLILGAWRAGHAKSAARNISRAYCGAVGMGIALSFTAFLPKIPQPTLAIACVAVVFIGGGVANGIHNVAVRNTIYHAVSEKEWGRAFSLYAAITRIAAISGFFAGGFIGAANAAWAYAISGLLVIAAGVTGWFVTIGFSEYSATRK